MLPEANEVGGFLTQKGITHRILYYEAQADGPDMVELRDIDAELAYEYYGDFYGLLLHLQVPARHQFLCLYLNGLKNPLDFDGEPFTMKIPKDPRVMG